MAEVLGWRGYGSCVFCGSHDTQWQHDLDPSLVGFRTRFDRGHTWATAQTVCDGCEQRYRRGDYAALARLEAEHAQPESKDPYESSLLIQDHLIALAAFCRADLRVRALAVPDFPDGFEPLDEHTGDDWVTEVWPTQFRVSVLETRPDHEPGQRLWLLHSPWPSLNLTDTFTVLWTWAERDPRVATHAQRQSRVVEALAWTDAQATSWLAWRGDPPST